MVPFYLPMAMMGLRHRYQRMNHSLLKTDTGRINIDAYPQRAVFEWL